MRLGTEQRAWTLIYACLAVVEGGTAAVMVRSLYGGRIGGLAVDLVLAMVSAAPAWASLASLAYARAAQGRPKIGFLQPLLLAMTVCVAGLALLPGGGWGLLLFFALYGAARLLWTGVETVRSVLWSANYPRHLRARITGRIMVGGYLALAGVGLLLGWLLEQPGPGYRVLIVVAALCGVAGAVAFRGLRVRNERSLLEAEARRHRDGARFDLAGVRDLLRRDADYRRYMVAMTMFGAGNLMFTPLVVVCLDDVLRVSSLWQVAVTTAVPILAIPFAIQPWARFLDGHHVVVFRSVHGWVTLAAMALLSLAVWLDLRALLLPGAVLHGVSLAGGSLGWSLGHNDFAPRGEETRYMALHVTLTGLRGLVFPAVGIGAYYALGALVAGSSPLALLLPIGATAAGALSFRAMRREQAGLRRRT